MGEVRKFGRLGQGPPPRLRSGLPPVRWRRSWRDRLSWASLLAAVFLATAGMGALLLEGGTAPSGVAALAHPGVDVEQARFTRCVGGRGTNCIIDGDTFRYRGDIIRIADIDTPEARGYRCPSEKTRADAATARLLVLMNAGPFTLAPYHRDRDQYGRALRIITRDGQSLGMTLVAEGHARVWDGARHGWC